MPFDLARTTHIFRMTDSGGVERVIVKDATAKDQVALIQQHLQHEAEAFQRATIQIRHRCTVQTCRD